MSAMTFTTGPGLGGADALVARLRAQSLPLACVLLFHVILFYFISSGLLTRMVDVAVPKAVIVNFVAPPAPKPAEPVIPHTPKLAPPPLVVPPPVIPMVQIDTVRAVVSTVQPAAVVAEKTPAPAAPVVVATPPAPPSSGPKTITSGVEYIKEPQPVYPQMSRRMGEQGKVVLRVLVNEKGLPDQVQVQTSSGSARLDEAGRQAALRALFKPHLEDGRAVAVYVIVPLNFQIAS